MLTRPGQQSCRGRRIHKLTCVDIGAELKKIDQFSSLQEAEEHLRSACGRSIECLQNLSTVHLTIDPPERVATESDDERVLRLRKVCFHVRAITSWTISSDSLHVMGPDVRAAREQLEPIALKIYKEEDYLVQGRSSLKTQTQQLPSYSHPTPMTLVQARHLGGFGRDDTIRWLGQLYLLLIGLALDYALGLEVIAEMLDRTKLPEVSVAGDQVRLELFSPLNEAALRFGSDT